MPTPGQRRPADRRAAGQAPSDAQYLREYLRWLRPHRYAVAVVFVLALMVAGLQMIEPLFMRFIIDRVLLNTDAGRGGAADAAAPRRARCSWRSIVAVEPGQRRSRTTGSGC